MTVINGTKLVLFEGIPGSGKTTLTKKTYDYLSSKDLECRHYLEGGLHPVDLVWCAYLTLDEYYALLEEYPQYADSIIQSAQIEEHSAVIAYLQMKTHNEELMAYLQSKEIFDGRLNTEHFCDLFIKRFKQFAAKNAGRDAIQLFDCAVLQNQINELLCFHNVDHTFIVNHIHNLMNSLMPLNPTLVYLRQKEVGETIKYVASKRKSPNTDEYPDWIDLVITYIEKSTYGQKHQLQGFDGVIDYYRARQALEVSIVHELPQHAFIMDRVGSDWDELFQRISDLLDQRTERQILKPQKAGITTLLNMFL